MAQSDELKKIKRIYGEKFSRLCRELFPQILDQEGALLKILQEKFSRNCNTLCESIEENGLKEDFKDLIYTAFDDDREEEDKKEDSRTPYEILDEAGYELHECLTEEDIQEYRKYYKENEVLCTIYNGGRLNSRVCFWATKKDVDQIEREDFEHPKKDDEYSTSVLAIQFDKQPKSRVEIISRYNHTVPNPNCTLNNNLNNIAEGLQESFARLLEERGYSLNAKETMKFEIPGYTLTSDGKYYKYNLEIDGKYYCPGNIVIEDGIAKEIGNPEEVILCDYFKIDLKNKKVDSLIDNLIVDSFVGDLTDIEKIEVKKDKEKGKRLVIIYKKKEDDRTDDPEPIVIELDYDNQIVGYTNKELQNVGDNFLSHNRALTELNLPQVQSIGGNFLHSNEILAKLSLPQVQSIEDNFLYCNKALTELQLPQVQSIGDNFLYCNKALTELQLPQVQSIGDNFLYYNEALTEVSLPQVQSIEDNFLAENNVLTELNLPQVQSIGGRFLFYDEVLTELNLPQVQSIGCDFLCWDEVLAKLSLPQVQSIEDSFLHGNRALTELNLPQVQSIEDSFLHGNRALTELNLPQVQSIGGNFLCCNEILVKLSLPQVKSIEDNFLTYNEALTEVSLPQVQSIGNNFLYKNKALTEVNLPQIQSIGSNFLPENKALTEVNLPQIQSIGWNFLYENKALTEVSMPQVLEIENKFLENNATFAEMFRRGWAEAIREYSARAKQENITPENALRCALSQGITTEQVNQANKIEQEQAKSKKQEYGKQQ